MEAGQEIRDYILEEILGRGATGEIWKARHKQFSRTVAIKLIHENVASDPDLSIRIRREAETMEIVSHPHVVHLLEYFLLDERQPVLVMRYVEGESLQNRIDGSEDGKLGLDEALRISRDILSALDAAHQNGRFHRDVKPANILLDGSSNAFLTDFGIAHALGREKLTRTGTLIGTPEYMSPEQIQGKEITHLTDVYSFGCVMYEMLAGKPPFGSRDDGSTDYEIMSRHINENPESVQSKNSQIDDRTANIIHAALEKDPLKRPGGCAEMSRRLFEAEQPDSGVTMPPDDTKHDNEISSTDNRNSYLKWGIIVLTLVVSAMSIIWLTDAYNGSEETRNNGKQASGLKGPERVSAYETQNPKSTAEGILNRALQWESEGDCKAAEILLNRKAEKHRDVALELAKRYDPDGNEDRGCFITPDRKTAEYFYDIAKKLGRSFEQP